MHPLEAQKKLIEALEAGAASFSTLVEKTGLLRKDIQESLDRLEQIGVPKEFNPRDYITDTPPEGESGFEVPDDSMYYHRRLSDGDLVLVEETAAAASPAAATEAAPAVSKKDLNNG